MTRTRKLLLALGALLVLLALLLYGLGTAPVLRGLAGTPLQGLEGSIWNGLRAARLQGESAGLRWSAEGVELAPLRWRGGGIESSLHLRRLQLQLSSSGGPPLQPEALLAALRWPSQLRLTPLRIDELIVNGQLIQNLQLNLQAGGPQTLLGIEQLRGRWQGAQLALDADLQDGGGLQLKLAAQREALDLRLQGRGDLRQLPISLRLLEGQAERLQGELRLAPLAPQPLLALQARFQGLDPRALHAQAPQGDWSGSLDLQPTKGPRLRISAEAQNRAARRLDQQGWPLRSLALQLELDPAQWQLLELQRLSLELGSESQGAGRLALAAAQGLPRAGQALQSRLLLQAVQLQQLNRAWPQARLDGQLELQQSALKADAPLGWQTALKLSGAKIAPWQLQARGSLMGRRLQIASADLQGQGRLQLKGEAELLDSGWATQGMAEIQKLRLALPPWTVESQLQGRLDWRLEQGKSLLGELRLQMQDGNQLAGLAVLGDARWTPGPQAAPWQLSVQAADGSLQLSGQQDGPQRDLKSLASAAAWLPQQATWQFPELERLRPLWLPWLKQLAGSSQGELRWAADGTPQLQLRAQNLRLQQPAGLPMRLTRLVAELSAEAQGRLQIEGLQQGLWQLETLNASGARDKAWQLEAEGARLSPLAGEPPQRWSASGRSEAPQISENEWRFAGLALRIAPKESTAPPWLLLEQGELSLQPPLQAVTLTAPTLKLAGEALQLQRAEWRANGPWQLALQGRPRLAAWLGLIDPRVSWGGEARASLRLSASQQPDQAGPRLLLQLSELQGDLTLDRQALGLQSLAATLQQEPGGSAQLSLALQSSLLGEVDVRLTQSDQAALAGSARARLPRLQTLRPWLPAGLQLEGTAQLDAQLGGTRAAPRLRGGLALQLDRLQHPPSGVALQQGRIAAQFNEDRLEISELRLAGSGEGEQRGGQLSGSGQLIWGGEQLQASLQLKAEQLRVLNRFDRRLVLSGDAELQLLPQKLRLIGKLTADEGVFEIGRPDAPVLDDDVVLIRDPDEQTQAAQAKKVGRLQREVDLQFDLGQRLRVQGRGFASRLTGQLRLQERDGRPMQATGRIETQGGRYKAYGQTLDLETGEIRFTGSLENPRLDLLAIKPDIEHRVGVSVTGTAQAPRIRLYAEPDLPENDKLAWLLLGRDPSELASRDTALLQRAAMALLSGEGENPATQLMDKLGLTEFSVSDGEDAGTVLRLGARLSQRWSVGYERSLNATSGSWQLVYRLGQRFRLRAQSGTDSAVDLLWLWRYD